jgi:hypothetical protein
MTEFYGAANEEEFAENMNAVAYGVDALFNGEANSSDRKIGFVLLVFPFRDHEGRCDYISNGANRQEVVAIMKRQIKRLEGQPEITGWALRTVVGNDG